MFILIVSICCVGVFARRCIAHQISQLLLWASVCIRAKNPVLGRPDSECLFWCTEQDEDQDPKENR